jgi:hypothetical protein
MRADREPHIGEYDTKTNAICDFSQIPAASGARWLNSLAATLPEAAVLLPVVFQHLIARRRNPGTILLKAGQNREITLIYDRAAEAMNIARAGFLLVRCATLLGDGPGGNRQRQQDKYQERFMHRIPSF